MNFLKISFFKLLLVGCTVSIVSDNAYARYGFEKQQHPGQKIGTVDELMPRFGNNIGPGSFIADAMLNQTMHRGAAVALIGSFEVRSDLLPGYITKYDIRQLTFNTPLITFDVTVSELKTLVEKIASRKQRESIDNNGIHVAGIRFSFDKKAESGKKVSDLEIGSLDDGYRIADPTESVRVVSTVYVLTELIALKGRKFLWEITLEYQMMHQVLEQYLYSLQTPLSNCTENRINDVHSNIMVFSDPHYFDPSLLISNGLAFQTYLAQDRKLIAESHAILLSTVSKIRSANPEICLIPGDLTKDGELISHNELNQIITDSLLSAGIKVYIAPGNHDINNKEAYSYNGSTVLPVESVTSEQFTQIHENLGYGEAIARDSASLTYIVEPENGLWIMSIDACKYGLNETHSHTGGTISESTLQWILTKLDYARKHNITVFGMMHHGVTEHYTGQTQIMMGMFKDYVVDNWMDIRDTLATHGLKVIFTGHYHAQDIVQHTSPDGSFIFDIETGSTVTWPCPVRTVALSPAHTIDISTSTIEQIDYPLPVSFQQYAKTYLVEGLTGMINYILTTQFNVPAQMAQMLSPAVAAAFSAHYAGDEQAGPVEIGTYMQLKMSPDPMTASMGLALESLWNDLTPVDNFCTIDLKNGAVK